MNSLRIPGLILTAALLTGALGGCGSSLDAKGEAALKRIRARSTPGYVRVINLGAAPLSISDRGRSIVTGIQPGAASKLLPIGVGKRTLRLNGTDDLNLNLVSNTGTTAIVYADGRVEMIAGDERRPTSNDNVRVVYVNGAAKNPPNLQLKGTASVSIPKANGRLLLKPGVYSLRGEEVKVEEGCAYTFYLVKEPRGLRTFLLPNTYIEKPVSGGMSAS